MDLESPQVQATALSLGKAVEQRWFDRQGLSGRGGLGWRRNPDDKSKLIDVPVLLHYTFNSGQRVSYCDYRWLTVLNWTQIAASVARAQGRRRGQRVALSIIKHIVGSVVKIGGHVSAPTT